MFGYTVFWFADNPLYTQWYQDYRALRIWCCSAGFTNANEAFIVFQNFMHIAGQDPLTPPRVFRQRCLALTVMVQALILGLPAGLYLLFVVALPALWRGAGFAIWSFTLACSLQIAAQLGIQVTDSIKVWKKLQ